MRNNPEQNRDVTSCFQRLLFTVGVFYLVTEGYRSTFLEYAKYNADQTNNSANLQRCIAFFLTTTFALVSVTQTAAHSLFPNRSNSNGYSPLPQNETESNDHVAITIPTSKK